MLQNQITTKPVFRNGEPSMKKVNIIGANLGGLTAAILLGRAG